MSIKLAPRESSTRQVPSSNPSTAKRARFKSPYSMWFHVPAGVLYVVLFAVPTFASFYFALTRWTLFDVEFIGLENFVTFFQERQFYQSFINTFVYAAVTATLKVVLGLALAVLLSGPILGRGFVRSAVFFPVLVSTIGIGITFSVLLDPFDGVVNNSLAVVGIDGPGWLTDPNIALLTVALIEVWKGTGIATLIFIAGLAAIPRDYYEAAQIDGANGRQAFWRITLPLAKPATATVIILSVIGGLRSFDLIWATTGGGPGFSSDVLASVVYKQYQAGFYGLSTAGNVILFLVVAAVVFPLSYFLNRRQVDQ